MSLEEKICKLEKIFERGEDVVREIQLEFLNDLRIIKKNLQDEEIEGGQDELKKEIQRLKEENQRLLYRIQHMKKHLE